MHKILIVDDEGLELQSLQRILEKDFGESVQIETGNTGRMAIELFESFRPDIILMDIQMPGINGIDAIREIRKNHTGGRFIVLTAYDSFEYVQEALNLGVAAYLTKPIHRQELLQEIRKQMDEIDKSRAQRRADLMLRERLDAAIPMLEAGFLYSILLAQDWDTVTRHYVTLLEIEQEYGYFLVTDFQMQDQEEDSVDLVRKEKKIRALQRELFRDSIAHQMGSRSLMAVPCDEPKDSYAARLQILSRANEYQSRLEELTGMEASVGIGGILPIRRLADSYQQAISALGSKEANVLHFDDLPLAKQWEEGYPQETEYAIYTAIEQENGPVALQTAADFFEWMAVHHKEDLSDVKLKVLELVMRAEYLVFHNGGRTYHFMERHGYLEEINEIDRIEELREWYNSHMHRALETLSQAKEETTSSSIEAVRSYISQNYSQNLTLNDVAELVHISPFYFSKLFKEKTGQNFIEYLTATRMEQAKQELEKTSLSVKEICMNVGYSDPNYFSRSFKKYAGMTPLEYRELRTGKKD